MSILIDELSVWDICFRWAGYDPRKFYFRIPLEAEDYARTLIDAIHKAELPCESITLEKREFAKDERKLSFYYWVDEFFSTTSGKLVSRDLLKWAHISRYDFMQWCQRMNAPLPEFWFPQGWNLQYELPENDYYPGLMHDLKYWPDDERKEFFENRDKSDPVKADLKTRPNQEAKISCQMIAKNLWRSDISISINDMVQRPEIKNLGGANSYQDAVVRRWLSEVAPSEVKARVGRPKKKNTTEDIST